MKRHKNWYIVGGVCIGTKVNNSLRVLLICISLSKLV